MPPKSNFKPQQQRFHGNRSNSMKIGLRGLLFTINPQNEPKAYRELSALMEKILSEYPAEYFVPTTTATSTAAVVADKTNTNNDNQADDDDDDNENDETVNDDDDENQEQQQQEHEQSFSADGSGGSTFADELKAELAEFKHQHELQNNQQATSIRDVENSLNRNNNSDDAEGQRQRQNKRPRKPFVPRRFKLIDTNCKGFAFVAINFNDELEAADRLPRTAGADQNSNETPAMAEDEKINDANSNDNSSNNHLHRLARSATQLPSNVFTVQNQQVFNFCVGQLPALILDIAKAILHAVSTSDVPLLRFTYYLYPCLSTAAPTIHSAVVLAEATKGLVKIPAGKSAAKVETHFVVRNNSGVSQPVVLNELKKNFQERLPMSKYFVVNQEGASGSRRPRQTNSSSVSGGEASAAAPQRIVNASVSYFVLHSVAALCIQPDFTEMREYALHKLGASFADSLTTA